MRGQRLLAVAVAVALAFTVAWLWRGSGDRVTERLVVADGATATVGGISYRLESLRTSAWVSSGLSGQVVATGGATLVIASVTYDATHATGEAYCSLELVAGDISWDPESGWIPPESASSFCGSGGVGTVSALFEVPDAFLTRIQGIGITNPYGASPLLLGRVG